MDSNLFKKKLTVGILGLAGSGKSTISQIFQIRGFVLINLDNIGHEILNKKRDLVISLFGKAIETNNNVDRKKLGEIVFSSKEKLNLLNSIIHPEIKKRVLNLLSEEKNHIIEGAVLNQIGLFNYLTHSIWIDINEDIALKRLVKRGIDRKKALNIIISQQFLHSDKDKCNFILDNNNGIVKFKEKALELYKIISSN